MTQAEEPLLRTEPELHPRLAAVLQRVHTAELTARGPQRRPTFRLMRELLGASVRLGIPPHLLAASIGSTPGAVRNRLSGVDGTLSPQQIQQLTDLTAQELERRSGANLATHPEPAAATPLYRTIDVIGALISTPPEERPVTVRTTHPA
jgi:hypothetical protein